MERTMEITVDRPKAGRIIGALVERWRTKRFPYEKGLDLLPQTFIPERIRKDLRALSNFYFFVCIYMRGGIESSMVFRIFAQMWEQHPELFDPARASRMTAEDIREILKGFIGWDSEVASVYWRENAERLHRHWGGNAHSIIDNIGGYDEALLRILNKKDSRLHPPGSKEAGFMGFQHKMVSMLLYFFDFEGWLPQGLIYPSPADFHHYRLFLTTGIMTVIPTPGTEIRFSDKISAEIRDVLMWHMKTTGTVPRDLADALWLFSLRMCGESPVTRTVEETGEAIPYEKWTKGALRRFERTCAACPFEQECIFAIPANAYYRRGVIELRKRPAAAIQLTMLPR